MVKYAFPCKVTGLWLCHSLSKAEDKQRASAIHERAFMKQDKKEKWLGE